jgi:microcompartment protein CcmK/EutM
MMLARVVGDTISTVKEDCFSGRKLLWVQPVGLDGKDRGDAIVSVDVVGAGAGERVLVLFEGGGAQDVCGVESPSPIGSAIVAIVDEVSTQ